jgi:serine/threonine protein kinase
MVAAARSKRAAREASANAGARRSEGAPSKRSPERRIRDVLDALAAEFEVFEHAGRVHSALTGASWNALQVLSRVARSIAAFNKPPGPATCLRHAAQREIARRPRYQIRERLGAGGMAEVFRGWQIGAVGFERPVAIKRLLPEVAQSYPWLVSHEAGLLGRMLHPNIVHVFDVVSDDDGQPLLVLEYVDGIDLRKLIDTGALPIPVILFLATEILNGLGYAHHLPADGSLVQGVVHRDLSPDNILLSWDGAVKIADFGIAKERRKTEVSSSTGVQGKPGYMSPEQYRGQRLDGRSDLYSVGVMLWELLTHERLFAPGGVAEGQLDRPPPRPSLFRPVPRDLEAVVMRLLRRDRERRYRTAEAAYDAIARCDGSSLLRGRVELVELLAERFPEQVEHRPTRRPPMPHTPTPSTPRFLAPPGMRPRLWDVGSGNSD